MTLIDKVEHWLGVEASEADNREIMNASQPEGGALATLNAVQITGEQLRAAHDAIKHIQVRSEEDMFAHARILSGFAEQIALAPSGYASAALHARLVAMDRWCHEHDPEGRTDVDGAFEAAARAPMIETVHGPGFDGQAFDELIEFISELPF